MTSPDKSPTPNSWVAAAPIYVAGQHAPNAVVLSANENPLGASPKALKALQDVALHRYPEGDAQTLRKAIASEHGLIPEHIVCGAGSDELIGLLIRAYCAPGDEILYSEHGFLMYAIAAQLAGVVPIKAKEKQYHCDPQAMLKAITDKTKIIFIANPNNPTGTCLSQSVLGDFIEAVPPHVLVVLDAAYAEYVETADYNAGELWVQDYANVVMLRTFSKLYGLAALRVGWMLAAEDIVATINRARPPFNLSQAGQTAAIAALKDKAHVKESLASNRRNKERLQKAVQQLGLSFIESHGNFLAVAFADEKHAAKALAYLQKQNILVRDIKAYGLPQYLRMTIGSDAETDRLVAALQDFLSGDTNE